jgi:hypothetical protein
MAATLCGPWSAAIRRVPEIGSGDYGASEALDTDGGPPPRPYVCAMAKSTTATPAPPARLEVQRRLIRLDRVVEQLRALERSTAGATAQSPLLSEVVRTWEREAASTRWRLAGSAR